VLDVFAIMKISRFVLLLLGVSIVSVLADPPSAAGGIGVYAGNPFYWEYQGKPVLLLGGSSAPTNALNDEGMFLWPDVIGSLDKLVAAGGNYTRCLMSGRLRGESLWPFLNADGRFDLDRWDDNYWHCFETFLNEAQKRGIVTDIELWATFDYARLPWTKNPFNPINNRNYSAEETGLPAEVKSHPILAENVFTTRCRTRRVFLWCSSINSALWIKSCLTRCNSTMSYTAWTTRRAAVQVGAPIGRATSETVPPKLARESGSPRCLSPMI
jgi:hypothetical protein